MSMTSYVGVLRVEMRLSMLELCSKQLRTRPTPWPRPLATCRHAPTHTLANTSQVDTRRLPYPDAAIVMAQRKHNDTDDTELSPLGKRIQEIFSQVHTLHRWHCSFV